MPGFWWQGPLGAGLKHLGKGSQQVGEGTSKDQMKLVLINCALEANTAVGMKSLCWGSAVRKSHQAQKRKLLLPSFYVPCSLVCSQLVEARRQLAELPPQHQKKGRI